jgi:hypothetical protein
MLMLGISFLSVASNILIIAELCALICGVITFKKWRHTHFSYLIYYLVWIVVTEAIGRQLDGPEYYKYDWILYTFFIVPLEFFFFYWLIQKSIKHSAKSKLVFSFSILFLIAFVFEMYFVKHDRPYFNSFSNSLGAIGLLILILQYFRELVTSNDILNFKRSMIFYIAFGLFCFYIISLPYYGLYNTLVYDYFSIFKAYKPIVLIMSSIMYLLFSFGFIWAKPN